MSRKVQRIEHQSMRLRTKFLITVSIVIIVTCIVVFNFDVRDVEIVGASYYTEEELEDYFLSNQVDHNTLLLYLKVKFGEKLDIPFIQKYDVDFVNQHAIKIQVYEKSLVGCIEYMGEYMYFDKDGYILEISKEHMEDIPLVQGVQFQEMTIFQKLAVADDKIFNTIMEISQLISKYELVVDRVVFNLYNEVLLYSDNIKIMLGKKDTYDEEIAELSHLLPKAEGLKGTFDMRDFKHGDNVIFNKSE